MIISLYSKQPKIRGRRSFIKDLIVTDWLVVFVTPEGERESPGGDNRGHQNVPLIIFSSVLISGDLYRIWLQRCTMIEMLDAWIHPQA